MKPTHYAINKYASIINRLGMMYFDQCLEQLPISSGQMFFLLRLSEHEGMSVLELAYAGYFDKGTTTRAVQRLEELQYIYRIADERDKRIQRLYVSEEGRKMLPMIKQAVQQWEGFILSDLSEEEIQQCEKLLIHMTGNACAFMNERKRELHERNHHK